MGSNINCNLISMVSRQIVVLAAVFVAVAYALWRLGFEDPTAAFELNHYSQAYRRKQQDVCYNDDAVRYLQTLQLKRGLSERESQAASGGGGGGGPMSAAERERSTLKGAGRNMPFRQRFINHKRLQAFYSRNFGGVNLVIPGNISKAVNDLFYYRIFKCANDYIRYLMYRYAYYFGDKISFKDNNCKLDECVDNDVYSKSALELRNSYFSVHKRKRMPFTFVRSPLSRFISAYTEVEYKWNSTGAHKPPPDVLPVDGRVGTISRFEEFVSSLIEYFGKPDAESEMGEAGLGPGTIYSEDDEVMSTGLFDLKSYYFDMSHVAPMMGAVLLARDKERDGDLHIYKLESFEEDWRNLSIAVGLSKLDSLVLSKNPPSMYIHASGNDTLNTTLAAISLLGYATDETFSHLYYQHNKDTDPEDGHDVSCTDKIFCYKNQKIAMPPSTPKQFQDLRRRSIAATRAICRLYQADFQCLGYELPSVCEDMAAEWSADSQEFFQKKAKRHGLFSSASNGVSVILKFLPYQLRLWVSEAMCLFESSPPACMVELIYSSDSITNDPSDLDENEVDGDYLEEGFHDEL